MDFIPSICRTPSAEKSVTLVGRSAIDADLSARALEELLGRTHYGAATNRFSALPLALAVFDCSVCLCHNFVEVFNLICFVLFPSMFQDYIEDHRLLFSACSIAAHDQQHFKCFASNAS